MLSQQFFWTVKAKGIHTTTSGTSAIFIGGYKPTGPNPADTVWEGCHQNFIYFHQRADGEKVDEQYVDRMLSIALAAFKTDSYIRVGINRSESGRCYTSQVFNQGS